MSAHLYQLHEGHTSGALDRVGIVEAACARAGVGFVSIDSLTADHTNLPNLRPGDMLFNAGRGSVRLETLLTRPWVATFRDCGSKWITNGSDTTVFSAALEATDIPQPRTVHRLPHDSAGLVRAVDFLGGFPVVIKVVGGTLGVGAMVVESMRSLRSIADYLRTTGDEFILREFIPAAHVARIVVLGERVIASLKYAMDAQDFRGLPYRMGGSLMNFGEQVETLAIAASKAACYEFTGVDILIDEQDRPFVLEVNPPSNFVALEHDLGVPVGDMIVAHLMAKAERLASAA